MVKIAFHDNMLSETGTSIALFDYAFYNQTILKNESIILFNGLNRLNVKSVVDRFSKNFTVYVYSHWNQVDQILEKEGCDILYMIKDGRFDNKISKRIKTVIHCVFYAPHKHGDVYAMISSSVGSGYPIVPHMINLPDIDKDMREELNIPKDAIVIGRHGGYNSFDLRHVHIAIDRFSDKFPFVYFLMLNTKSFCKRKRNIIHLDKIVDLERKTMFINSCDAMIHARKIGETFGLSVGEFSTRNKPIITCRSGKDNTHLDILKGKCIFYGNTVDSVLKSLIYICRNAKDLQNTNWNMYTNYSPEKVMRQFDKVFIQPCLHP